MSDQLQFVGSKSYQDVLASSEDGIIWRRSVELNRKQSVGHSLEGYAGHTFSINLPIPVTVMDLPPKICAASSAISLPVRVMYLRNG